METISAKAERMHYVDVLRGFSMLLVVYMHVAAVTMTMPTTSNISPLSTILYAMRMPLFFFISGFIGYKDSSYWTSANFAKRLSNKSRVQLIPTFVFFGIFYIFVLRGPFPQGYWFTLTLFEMFLIYFIVGWICNRTSGKIMLPALFAIAVALIVFRTKVRAFFPYDEYYGINETCTYLGFFVLGLTVRRYNNYIWQFLEKRYVLMGMFVWLVVFFFLIHQSKDWFNFKMSASLSRYVFGIPLVLIVFNYFRLNQEYWSGGGKISKIFQYVGRRTFDIYLLHYYFLYPSIGKLSAFLEPYNNEALIFIICGSLTLVIVSLCLVVSSILRSSREVSYWLFGDKIPAKL